MAMQNMSNSFRERTGTKWKTDNSDSILDLCKAHLSGVDLGGGNLRTANLRGTNLRWAGLRGPISGRGQP